MDDIRTKVISALEDGLFGKVGAAGAYSEYAPDDGDNPNDWQRVDGAINLTFLADFLIRELGWRREVESYAIPDSTRHRYVTEWETGE